MMAMMTGLISHELVKESGQRGGRSPSSRRLRRLFVRRLLKSVFANLTVTLRKCFSAFQNFGRPKAPRNFRLQAGHRHIWSGQRYEKGEEEKEAPDGESAMVSHNSVAANESNSFSAVDRDRLYNAREQSQDESDFVLFEEETRCHTGCAHGKETGAPQTFTGRTKTRGADGWHHLRATRGMQTTP